MMLLIKHRIYFKMSRPKLLLREFDNATLLLGLRLGLRLGLGLWLGLGY